MAALRSLFRGGVSGAWKSFRPPGAAVAAGAGPFPESHGSDLVSSRWIRASAFSSQTSCLAVSELSRFRFSNPRVLQSTSSFSLSCAIPVAFVAPLSTLSSALYPSAVRCSLAALRLGGIVYRGPEQLVMDSSAMSMSMQMQHNRSLSKLKKYKLKSYSSYKKRFKLMADGTYKRWRSGTRHNAHSKTAKQRRQLRRPSTAPVALAKVMKKLHFVR